VALTSEQAEHFDARVGELAETAFDFLARLVACESTVGQEQAAQQVLAEELVSLGFAVEELAVPETIGEHPLAGVPQGPYAGRFDVVGRLNRPSPAILFNGHIDVVPADRASWASDPFAPVRKDGWLIGRGAGDMKGGTAMVLLALRALQSACPSALELPIGYVSVIEEECTGNGTLASLLAGIGGRVVVLPEPSDLGAQLAGVGVLWVDLELSGAGGHAYAADRLATPVGALPLLLDAIDDLGRSWSAEVDDPDFAGVPQLFTTNVGTIACGDWRSSVVSRARLGVRVGFPRGVPADEALRRVSEAAHDALGALGTNRARNTDGAPGASGAQVTPAAGETIADEGRPIALSVEASGFRAEGYRLDPADELVELLDSCHRSAHGRPLRRFGLGSTTDARYYINQLEVPALCYGPVTRNIHGADEAVQLQSIVDGARTIGRLIARLGELDAVTRPTAGLAPDAVDRNPGPDR
jgi:acetylornithine deacetylase